LDHIVEAVTVDIVVAFDTIVALIIAFVALLTSSPVEVT
jgi:hypothetical protein